MKTKLSYTGIRVRDLDESVKFYTGLLGMKETGRSKIESSNGQVVGLVSEDGGPSLELNFYEKGSKFDTPYTSGEELDHIAFQVGDLDKFTKEAGNLGHKVVQEMYSGTSKWAYIKDPNGIWIEIFP